MTPKKKIDKMNTLQSCADTLNRAADIAAMRQDTEVLISIAAGWIELHDRLTGEKDDKKHVLGFAAGAFGRHPDEEEEDEEDDNAAASDD